jgi:hypothetical protein
VKTLGEVVAAKLILVTVLVWFMPETLGRNVGTLVRAFNAASQP